MNEKFDHDLDVLLKRHLESRLRGQLGRATIAFRREYASRRTNPRAWRRWISAGASLAASLAVAWSLIAYRGGTSPTVVPPPNSRDQVVYVDPTPVLETATWTPVVDEGLGMVDNQPVRKLKRNVVEQVEWFDPRHKAVVRTTTPKEQIFLIDVKTD
jgi:hypothetical protein